MKFVLHIFLDLPKFIFRLTKQSDPHESFVE